MVRLRVHWTRERTQPAVSETVHRGQIGVADRNRVNFDALSRKVFLSSVGTMRQTGEESPPWGGIKSDIVEISLQFSEVPWGGFTVLSRN